MSTVQNKLTQTQAQLAQGKQIINASDSPNQVATIQRLKSILNRQESYQSSLNTVKARLEGEDSTLRSVSDLLVRAKEVAVQGANDTLSAGDRKALDKLLDLADLIRAAKLGLMSGRPTVVQIGAQDFAAYELTLSTKVAP